MLSARLSIKSFFTRCRRSGLPTKKPPRFLSDESGEILFPETIFLIVAVVVIAVVLGMAVCCLICVFVFCSVFRTVCLFAVLSVHISVRRAVRIVLAVVFVHIICVFVVFCHFHVLLIELWYAFSMLGLN